MAINLDKFFKNEEVSVESEPIVAGGFGLRIIRPNSFGMETRKIIELIKKGNIVAFNLENLSSEDGQRSFDFINGATIILGGRIEKITDKVFASVPAGVSVESLETNEVENTEE
ncbi:cell division protein SepF [Oceanivirga salmonicida]|uniref:cell division protein SepF n=1 Tax=Oceanivirga salmonicida TaxID=1769291 RepID=UPI00082A9059|nr:cell division protein SepF [Oceanivirga salmonicida]